MILALFTTAKCLMQYSNNRNIFCCNDRNALFQYHPTLLRNCRAEVEEQIQTMLKKCIIEESSSAWMALAVFVHKKNRGVQICIYYRALNKQTVKDAYPLPLPHPDDLQHRFAGCIIFSTLDLLSGILAASGTQGRPSKDCILPRSRPWSVSVP